MPGRTRSSAVAEASMRPRPDRDHLTAYGVYRARVFGRGEPSDGTKPFTALVAQIMSAELYASARRVFLVVDNEASRWNWGAADRLSSAYPNA
jgi:hypothetical protein